MGMLGDFVQYQQHSGGQDTPASEVNITLVHKLVTDNARMVTKLEKFESVLGNVERQLETNRDHTEEIQEMLRAAEPDEGSGEGEKHIEQN
jgi:hypothetical protein